VWADSTAATPKKYSYAEWAYFLKLLGEDEGDSSLHEGPPSPTGAKTEDVPNDEQDENLDPGSQRQQDFEAGGQESAHTRPSGKIGDEKVPSWSWIGNRSPLMGDKAEAEWLLEKLFQRLEESLHDIKKEKEDPVKREAAKHHHGRPSTAGDGLRENSSGKISGQRKPEMVDNAENKG
jgi:potassium channel subfamily K